MCCKVNSPVTRPPPSTPHGWGKDRSNDAATGSRTGSPASTCSRALYSPFPARSLHTDTNTVRTPSAYSDRISPFAACHGCFQSNFLYPPHGRAACSSPSCELHSCPCPSWLPRRPSLPPPAASALIWLEESSCTALGHCLATREQTDRERNGPGHEQ